YHNETRSILRSTRRRQVQRQPGTGTLQSSYEGHAVPEAHHRSRDRLRRDVQKRHQAFRVGRRGPRDLVGYPTFGVRSSVHAGRRRHQLVLPGTEAHCFVYIRFGVHCARRRNQRAALPQTVKYFMAPPAETGIPLHENNQGAIRRANNWLNSRRTRHIDVKHHVVGDAVDSSIIRVEYVNSAEQHADILTKALNAKAFERHARFLINGA
ncbi:unnamed protein product, partial [Sphacelaria rigidula]